VVETFLYNLHMPGQSDKEFPSPTNFYDQVYQAMFAVVQRGKSKPLLAKDTGFFDELIHAGKWDNPEQEVGRSVEIVSEEGDIIQTVEINIYDEGAMIMQKNSGGSILAARCSITRESKTHTYTGDDGVVEHQGLTLAYFLDDDGKEIDLTIETPSFIDEEIEDELLKPMESLGITKDEVPLDGNDFYYQNLETDPKSKKLVEFLDKLG